MFPYSGHFALPLPCRPWLRCWWTVCVSALLVLLLLYVHLANFLLQHSKISNHIQPIPHANLRNLAIKQGNLLPVISVSHNARASDGKEILVESLDISEKTLLKKFQEFADQPKTDRTDRVAVDTKYKSVDKSKSDKTQVWMHEEEASGSHVTRGRVKSTGSGVTGTALGSGHGQSPFGLKKLRMNRSDEKLLQEQVIKIDRDGGNGGRANYRPDSENTNSFLGVLNEAQSVQNHFGKNDISQKLDEDSSVRRNHPFSQPFSYKNDEKTPGPEARMIKSINKSASLNNDSGRSTTVFRLLSLNNVLPTPRMTLSQAKKGDFSRLAIHHHEDKFGSMSNKLSTTLENFNSTESRNLNSGNKLKADVLFDGAQLSKQVIKSYLGSEHEKDEYVASELEMDPGEQTEINDTLETCPDKPTGLFGRLKISRQPMAHYLLVSIYSNQLHRGGHFKPSDCRPVEKTAIIIPYRNRWQHLHALLPVLIPMLIRQKIEFTIYIIAQDQGSTFNKGFLLNTGYLEALTMDRYDCFIFQDIDIIPVDDRNMYKCNNGSVVHFLAVLDSYGGYMPYSDLFGGVVGFTRDQFRAINGASNLYFGWGAEDDDMRDRTFNKGLKIVRRPRQFGVYSRVEHSEAASGWRPNSERFRILKTRLRRQHVDGLNSAVYKVTSFRLEPLYTWITIAIDEAQVIQTVPAHLRHAWWSDQDFKGKNEIVIDKQSEIDKQY